MHTCAVYKWCVLFTDNFREHNKVQIEEHSLFVHKGRGESAPWQEEEWRLEGRGEDSRKVEVVVPGSPIFAALLQGAKRVSV